VNYHLRALEGAGVVEFVEERPKGGRKEFRFVLAAYPAITKTEEEALVPPIPGGEQKP
jgi:hypothetical protein